MNVFLLDRNHEKRAEYHCDTHVNKLLLEGAQILNTALHLNDAPDHHTFYQPTHSTHPWTVWAADRRLNWAWLFDHTTALADEFCRRSDSDEHATDEKMREYWGSSSDLANAMRCIPDDGPRSPFPICTGDFEPETDNPIEAYREYYVECKVPQDWATWTKGVPDWVLSRQ